jgi:excisionase family DNA binding protein
VTREEAAALYTWLKVADVARELDVTEECVRNWIRQGELPASNFGHYRIRPEDFRAFIEGRSTRKAS